jgi:RNA recognition motif-containing protein
MFPTLTSFEKDINNPYLTRTSTSSTTTVTKPQTSITSSHAPATSKLLVSNLPLNFNEDSVYKFLRTFGKIKSLEMIKDPITGQYSGQCHVEYETEASTTNALQCII